MEEPETTQILVMIIIIFIVKICKKHKPLILQDAINLRGISENHSPDVNSAALDRVVFIDSTWQQCHQIINVSTKSNKFGHYTTLFNFFSYSIK